MTKREQFKKLFPLKGEITQKIIANARIYNVAQCTGALTLVASLGENAALLDGISWGDDSGHPKINGKYIEITTIEHVNFPSIITPQSVTFIINKEYDRDIL